MTARIVNTHEAKSRLSELIREAEGGAEVIVARNGHPVARIVPWRPANSVRVPGAWAGQVEYGDGVVGSDEEVVAMFDESAEADLL
ncbi:MAG: type II toxin-antitoxin system prevent-host-death family antitoxin [bacterium]|nr:type II toxin-antitoxin system prevent-host-death family antitoxin [bacterium]